MKVYRFARGLQPSFGLFFAGREMAGRNHAEVGLRTERQRPTNRRRGGMRSRHPDYSDEEVRLATIHLTLGEKLFGEAYPGVDVRP